MRARAVLFGPFVGELSWEFFRFAPHAIYLKKKDPNLRIIVLTREEHFDLYGQYSDILLPLRIRDDDLMQRDCFKLSNYKEEYYNTIIKYFKIKYRRRFNIINHIRPDIRLWRYKVKWQLPRSEMDYDFKPRKNNVVIAEKSIDGYLGIVDCAGTKARSDRNTLINSFDLYDKINENLFPEKCSELGSMIECIKRCNYIIGNVRTDISHLGLLMGIPVIHTAKKIDSDALSLINPRNTPVINAPNIEEGLIIYENNF